MTWNDAIIEVLRSRGGDVGLQAIYDELENHPIVTDKHRKSWRPGLQPRYQCWIRRSLTSLVREGKVRRIKPATYQLIKSN